MTSRTGNDMWCPSAAADKTNRVEHRVWRLPVHEPASWNKHHRLRGCRADSGSEDQWQSVARKELLGQQRLGNGTKEDQGFIGHRQEILCVFEDCTRRTKSRVDRRISFGEHLQIANTEAIQYLANLAWLMPKISGYGKAKLRLVTIVVHSKLLYAAQVWGSPLDNDAILFVPSSAERCVALRIISA